MNEAIFSNAFFADIIEIFTYSEESLKDALKYFDQDGQLHCLTGPAFENDNFGIWAIHGEIYSNLERYVEDARISAEEAIMLSLRYSGILPTEQSKEYALGY